MSLAIGSLVLLFMSQDNFFSAKKKKSVLYLETALNNDMYIIIFSQSSAICH